MSDLSLPALPPYLPHLDEHAVFRVVAALLYVGLAGWLATELPGWQEGSTVYPSPAAQVLRDDSFNDPADPAPHLAIEAPCAGSDIGLRRSASRPRLSLCVRGRSYPIMIMTYAAGVFYWPAELLRWWHQDDLVRLRWLGMGFGLLALLLTTLLVARVSDPTTATVAMLLMAVTPCVSFINGLLVHYETLPWLLTVAGVLSLLGPEDAAPERQRKRRQPSSTRLAIAGLCFGAAVASSVKALFLMAPLLLVQRRVGGRIPLPSTRKLGLFILMVGAGLTPLLLSAGLDDGAGLSVQSHRRVATLFARLARLDLRWIWLELQNLTWFWADMLFYLDLAVTPSATPSLPALWVATPALGYSLWAAAGLWWRGGPTRGHRYVAAVCGSIFAGYVAVSALLYDQQPAANYAPIFLVFGVATAAALVALAGSLARALARSRRGSGPTGDVHTHRLRILTGLASLVMCAFVYSTVQRGHPSTFLTLSTNILAEREVAATLLNSAAEPAASRKETRLVSTTYNLAGTFQRLSDGRLRATQAHHFLACSDEPGAIGVSPCLVERLVRLIQDAPTPLRLLAPTHRSLIDAEWAAELPQAIRLAAERAGRPLSLETQGHTRGGVAVLDVWRVGGARP